jgi:hypothetical protein
MLTLLSKRTEEIQRFRSAPFQLQSTFKTPLKELQRFVATFLAPFRLQGGILSTDEVVFEPKNLKRELANSTGQNDDWYRLNIRAQGQHDVERLLQAALGDWVDFAFLPTPELFAIYADHDEYTTFYGSNESHLAGISDALKTAGFEPVENYFRESEGDRWR